MGCISTSGLPMIGCCNVGTIGTTGIQLVNGVRPIDLLPSGSTNAQFAAAMRDFYEAMRAKLPTIIPDITPADFGFHTICLLDLSLNPIPQPWTLPGAAGSGLKQYKNSSILVYNSNIGLEWEKRLVVANSEPSGSASFYAFRKGKALVSSAIGGIRAASYSSTTVWSSFGSTVNPIGTTSPLFCKTGPSVNGKYIEWNPDFYKINGVQYSTGFPVCPLPDSTVSVRPSHMMGVALYDKGQIPFPCTVV